jgi:hypothetical protein
MLAEMPPSVEAYVRATNEADLVGLLDTFVEDALVNDELCDHWGKAQIEKWAAHEVIEAELRMRVTKVVNLQANTILNAEVVGNFDTRGLPDPLVLAFYFSIVEDKIIQLIILRNRSDV